MGSSAELQHHLVKLEKDMAKLVDRYPEPHDFIFDFTGHADLITDHASATNSDWAWAEIDRVLSKYGYGSWRALSLEAE